MTYEYETDCCGVTFSVEVETDINSEIEDLGVFIGEVLVNEVLADSVISSIESDFYSRLPDLKQSRDYDTLEESRGER